MSPGGAPTVRTIVNPGTITRGTLILKVMSRRTNDVKAKLASKLITDNIYVEVVRQGYVHEYEWKNLPRGDQAALVLDVAGTGDPTGVDIHSAEVAVISSKGANTA